MIGEEIDRVIPVLTINREGRQTCRGIGIVHIDRVIASATVDCDIRLVFEAIQLECPIEIHFRPARCRGINDVDDVRSDGRVDGERCQRHQVFDWLKT